MTFTPTNWQTLLLWSLISEGGQGWQKDRGNWSNFKTMRDGLEGAGLIEVSSRKRLPTSRKSNFLEVTDSGWAWSAENLDAELPRSQHSVPILRAFLIRLQAWLKVSNVSLAEFIMAQDASVETSPVPAPAPTPPAPEIKSTPDGTPVAQVDQAGLEQKIEQACLSLTDGRVKERIRLYALRDALPDIERSVLDRTLLDMQNDEKLVLMPLDNKREITDKDREAMLKIGNNPRHILYFGE